MAKRTPEERFWPRVIKTPGCWLWDGATDECGYGTFSINSRRKVRAHRYAYMLLVGPIPEGLELDHVKANGCMSRACVKAVADEHGPAHLEPVTHRENILRSDNPAAKKARQTHCKRGHELTEANVYRNPNKPNGRYCRRCGLDRTAQWRWRKLARNGTS